MALDLIPPCYRGCAKKLRVNPCANFFYKRRNITRMIRYTFKKAKNCFLSQDLYSRLI
jgi:hypothetical protein